MEPKAEAEAEAEAEEEAEAEAGVEAEAVAGAEAEAGAGAGRGAGSAEPSGSGVLLSPTGDGCGTPEWLRNAEQHLRDKPLPRPPRTGVSHAPRASNELLP